MVAASGFCGVWAGPIAGKPAPTGFSVDLKMCELQKYCGSWLASDEAKSPKENISLLSGERQPQYMADFQPTPTGAQ
jgi:hypothetical protein